MESGDTARSWIDAREDLGRPTASARENNEDDIYRIGIFAQFNLIFELAVKALQQVMRDHGVQGSETGSPRELLQLGYKIGFVDDETVWLTMLKKRNTVGFDKCFLDCDKNKSQFY